MKNVIITGSSGMIGSLVLENCLTSDKIKRVVAINRRESGIDHPKLTELVHTDFLDYTLVENHFKSIDIAYYCIGVYTGQVSRDEFRKITFDYTKAFADILKKHSPGAAFCFLSGQGADQTEKSRMMFAKDKGAAENYLLSLNFRQTYIFRPAYIYPVTPRKEPNFTYKITRAIYPLLKLVYPNGVIRSTDLANALFMTGLTGGDKVVLENKDIKKAIQFG
jgi:nucleoside-diphosphate-sugar epimerase